MKIRKIIDICKRRGYIALIEGEREQWISDGSAVFPLYDLPPFDENSLYKTYDITAEMADKMIFQQETKLPSNYDFSDMVDGEEMAQRGPMCIRDAGHDLIPYMTAQGVVFIDAVYLQPFSDIKGDMFELYERTAKNGQIYFAAKTGLMLVGIILPYDAIDEAFVERMKSLAKQCDIALFNKRSSERARDREK